ncbi:MAG: cobalt-precorrin-6A reductase [Phyllobacteriaceae bacterium]|nr:cobalt-precorrin-6A reductase [Phyllobacteriaceae bacterium]
MHANRPAIVLTDRALAKYFRLAGVGDVLCWEQFLRAEPRVEAARLASLLVASGHDVITSLAGRTKEPEPPQGNLRRGGFGGPEGLAAYLAQAKIDVLIDATHPFAKQISANARAAAALAAIPLIIHQRPLWQRQAGDIWIEVVSLADACNAIPPAARVLLALGSQHIGLFATRADVHFVVRMVDVPAGPLALPDHALVIGKPGDVDAEVELLHSRAISHIVCRNSGGPGAYAKIEAARRLALPVILINR